MVLDRWMDGWVDGRAGLGLLTAIKNEILLNVNKTSLGKNKARLRIAFMQKDGRARLRIVYSNKK